MSSASPSVNVNVFFSIRNPTGGFPPVPPRATPFLSLHTLEVDGHSQCVEIGRTTAPEDSRTNAKWKFPNPIQVQFFFELRQDLRATVQLPAVKFITSVDFQLAKVVAAKNRVLSLPMPGGWVLEATAVEISADARDIVTLQFGGKDLTKSPVYFKLFRVEPSGDENLLWQSIPTSGKHPLFPPTQPLELRHLSSADARDRNLRIVCLHKGLCSESLLGSVECSFHDLQCASDDPQRAPALVLKKVKEGGRIKVGGTVSVSLHRIHFPTFTEYLQSGYEMNLVVSVDCTSSNGDPATATSLHYMRGPTPNQYLRAIRSVGEVLMQYDTDKRVPVYGFGAQLPRQSGVSHFFPLNLSSDPNVDGVEGIATAYNECIPRITFNGPTNFAPTIRAVTEGARCAANVYTVLLILTDGEITDLPDTTDAIVEADDAPLSIVITGIGHACDFENMVYLDGDGTFLKHRNGRISRRDLVQFVPFRDFARAPPSTLAAEVLRELPDQFIDWARLAKGSRPGIAPAAPTQSRL